MVPGSSDQTTPGSGLSMVGVRQQVAGVSSVESRTQTSAAKCRTTAGVPLVGMSRTARSGMPMVCQ